MLLRFLIIFLLGTANSFASGYADTETLDANQHVIMFEKGVDAFMAGDYEKCDDYWLPLARSGDLMAIKNMALLYHRGIGVQKDLEEAEMFYRLAADKGVTSAQVVLGTLLIKGDEFKRNIPDAIKYLTAAYKAGSPIAAWNLGLLYENGVGVDKNLEKAMTLFHIAARGGHEPSIIRISGKQQDTYKTPEEVSEAVMLATQEDKNFDTRPAPVIPTEKTFQEKVKIDKEHDKNHFSDQINFNKDLQTDEPNMVFKNDLGEYQKKPVDIDKELDPFGIVSSKKNRLDEPFNNDKFGDATKLNQASKAFNDGDYPLAKKIWEELFKETKNDEAAYRLGKIYSKGNGVPKDLLKSYFYWKNGSDAGGKKSAYALEEFRAGLSDEELLEYEQKIM